MTAGELETKGPFIKKLIEYATKLDTTIILLAIAWVLKNKNVSVCLLGGSNTKQIEMNMQSIALAKRLDDKIMKQIDEILKNGIPFDRNANTRKLKHIVDAK